MKFDLNCDLGEGESPARTEALMRRVTSVNIACGGHAGTADSMRLCVRLAHQWGVRLGAHPGVANREGFGRADAPITPGALELLLLHQVSALDQVAGTEKIRLHHVKLHGVLYHATERNRRLARCYVQAVKNYWPGLKIYALAGGTVAGIGGEDIVAGELFLDRGYRDDGSLVPRGKPGALLTSSALLEGRLALFLSHGMVETVSGKRIKVRAQTFCIHSDTPGAARLLRIARDYLESGAG